MKYLSLYVQNDKLSVGHDVGPILCHKCIMKNQQSKINTSKSNKIILLLMSNYEIELFLNNKFFFFQ